MSIIDLKFGDPVVIRSLLNNVYPLTDIQLGYRSNDSQSEANIINWVKDYYLQYFGIHYKHILLTHGATGAIDMILGAKGATIQHIYFCDLAFGWYKKLAEKNDYLIGKVHHVDKLIGNTHAISIIDSPSNPWGDNASDNKVAANVIWDSVYASSAFTSISKFSPPSHEFMVGSFSKMFGLSGLRLGWIGTNNDLWGDILQDAVSTSYCGLSAASLDVADRLIQTVDSYSFGLMAKGKLDNNRNEFSKLSQIFSTNPLENGMFYMGVLDKTNRKLLNKAGIVGLEMKDLSGKEWIRFNVSDLEEKTSKAVKAILKADFKPKKGAI